MVEMGGEWRKGGNVTGGGKGQRGNFLENRGAVHSIAGLSHMKSLTCHSGESRSPEPVNGLIFPWKQPTSVNGYRLSPV